MTVFLDWDEVPDEAEMRSCYLDRHPDATRWLPNDEEAAHIVGLFLDLYLYTDNHLLHRLTGHALIQM